METDFVNAETVDCFADVSALILALESLNDERITFTHESITIPILHNSFAVLT